MKKNASANPSATVSQTSPFSSVVWLIPLLALITGAWLLIQHGVIDIQQTVDAVIFQQVDHFFCFDRIQRIRS